MSPGFTAIILIFRLNMSGQPNTCLNCSTEVNGHYCTNCGEKIYGQKDKKIGQLIEEALHFITHFEGRFFVTLKTLFKSPGQLSFDYCRGLRIKYFKPVSLYILLVVVYLIFPAFRGFNMTLEGHLGQRFYSGISAGMVKNKQEKLGCDYATLKTKFEQKSEKVSKILLLIVLPLGALVLALLFARKNLFFFDHFILSAELSSMFLLVFFLILPFVSTAFFWFLSKSLYTSLFSESNLLRLSIALLFSFSLVAFRRFYSVSLWTALLKSAAFSACQFFIMFMLYRFLQFVTVMWLI